MTNSVEKVKKAVEQLKKGQLIILSDDQNREHEGDLVGLGSFVTAETINKALSIGRGVLAVPITKSRATELGLKQMTENNSEKFGTKFTISVDYVSSTTGVSAYERATTIKNLANLSTTAVDFESPGHIFPLVAEDDGLLVRQGHTEGAVELAKIAGVPPVAYIIEILSEDGNMARGKELVDLSKKYHFFQLTMQDLINYRNAQLESGIDEGPTVHLPTKYGDFYLTEFQTDEKETILLMKSDQLSDDLPLLRVHSACATGDLFGSKRCECGSQLKTALETIAKQGGALIYLPQEGRGIGLHEKLKSYVLQENNFDTYDANIHLGHLPDERNYAQAATVLKAVGLTKVRLLTNNPDKVQSLLDEGIEVVDRVPLITGITDTNKQYMQTKKNKFNHLL
ncbi:riboflavin biosynthesis protein RibBA [Leuconostoc litchii]|uniref:3,4-dihydroxy-2-butanone-4-phosphate synthase n=1 Tax=Leuconostoc litchii TaxID=1981069 RepID=A0A6P2CM80_9LACO|nr:3,4-dihydroxy-2-butanone-4-phosphate synthase [Leuconostoc litchii]TYC47128.1 3,4-dihydroxy-2-butanone-4-phosphate synthase [Leuconostoc litchii]GMA69084.1 riboflavin biosynthesis protein RibBA [Leuconostoc litchii]